MALRYIANSWSGLRSGLKMGNEHSQPSPIAPASVVPDDEAFNPDEITSSSDNEIEPASTSNMPSSFDPPDSPSEPPQSSRAKKRKRQKRHKRRSSIDGSSVAIESEGGDLSSIPYRADEQTERAALVADTVIEDEVRDGIADAPDVTGRNSDHESSKGIPSDVEDDTTIEQPKKALKNPRSVTSTMAREATRANKYPCPQADLYNCDQTFTMLSSARRHADNVHLGQKFECHVCTKQFGRRDKLKQHQLTHTQEQINAVSQRLVTEAKERSSPLHDTHHAQEVSITADVAENTMMQDPDDVAPVSSLQAVPDTVHKSMNAESAVSSTANGQSSENRTASPASVFDEVASRQEAGNIAATRSRGKRKRDSHDHTEPDIDEKASKRARNGRSPPTSMTSADSVSVRPYDEGAGIMAATPTTVAPRKKGSKTGSLDTFAKPWKPGSQLFHPTLNPRSPRVQSSRIEVVVPRSAKSGSSSSKLSERLHQAANQKLDTSFQTPAISKKRKAEYTTSNGKGRAELDTEYSSPVRRDGSSVVDSANDRSVDGDNRQADDDDDHHNSNCESEEDDESGMATSVARKTSKRRNGRTQQPNRSFSNEPQSDSDIPASPSGDIYICQECNRKFSSRKALQRHENRSDVHKLQVKCDECNETFGSRNMLQTHQREAEHGDGTGFTGRKGNFSTAEVNKLLRWRDNFCHEYELTTVEFNNMMTDTSRRSKGFIWPYRFIKKNDFLQQYFDVLPNRNRRSMHRYRERAFQNVAPNQEWSKDDDKELADLVTQLGPRWVEIGQRMSRTQDSVCQRWRHKVQYRGKAHDGEWLPSETDQLIDAVNAVKRETGMSFDPHGDAKMPWESVSKKMKGSRTAQQCSNKWRLLYVLRVKGTFLRGNDADSRSSVSSTPISIKTPSKMTQRLAGKPSVTKADKRATQVHISEKYVRESDDDSSVGHELRTDNADDAELEASVASNGMQTEKIDNESNELQHQPTFSSAEAADTAEDQLSDGEPDKAESVQNGAVGQAADESDSGHEDDDHGESQDPQLEAEVEPESESESSDVVAGAAQNSVSSSPQAVQTQIGAHDAESNVSQDSDHDEDYDLPPQIPRNSISTTTPRNHPSLSQAFNQTQANTSAVRAPRSTSRVNTQPDRPSPNVTLQPRPAHNNPPRTVTFSQTNEDDAGASNPESESESGSESSPDDSSSGSNESDDEDDMVGDTRKESFLEALRQVLTKENGSELANSSQRSAKIDWRQALRGDAQNQDESSSDDE